jgi:hypothetical protein
VSWHLNYRHTITETTTREDRDERAVPQHLAEQTGRTFGADRRKVPVLFVEQTTRGESGGIRRAHPPGLPR